MSLTAENYFSLENRKRYMDVSQFKSFEKCEAAALAEIVGDYSRQSPAMTIGSYVDAWFEGTVEDFRTERPDLFKRDGTLKTEYAAADKVIDRVRRDDLFMEYMSGEKQVVMTGKIAGVDWKIKVDSLHSDKIVDLKVMRSFEDVYVPGEGRIHWAFAWEYDLQGAAYQEIVRQNTGEELPFYLAAATKEREPDITVARISQDVLDDALKRLTDGIPRFDAVKSGALEPMRCERCDYCKATKTLTKPETIGGVDFE